MREFKVGVVEIWVAEYIGFVGDEFGPSRLNLATVKGKAICRMTTAIDSSCSALWTVNGLRLKYLTWVANRKPASWRLGTKPSGLRILRP